MAVVNDRLILDGSQAYLVDGTALSDILTTGLFVKDAPEIVKGWATATHDAPTIITAAAEVRALHMVSAVNEAANPPVRFAIWKVYQQASVDGPEMFHGYLVIDITTTSTVASISAAGVLGAETVSKQVIADVIREWLDSPSAPPYDDPADLETDIGAANDKFRFTE